MLGPATRVLLYTDGLVERRDAGIDSRLEELRAAMASAPDGLSRQLDHLTAALSGDDVRSTTSRCSRCASPRRIDRGLLEVDDREVQRHLLRFSLSPSNGRIVKRLGRVLVAVEHLGGAQPPAGREGVDDVGNPFGGQRRRPVHDVEVQVRRARVAAVADEPDRVAALDPVAGLRPSATRLQVRIEHVQAVVEPRTTLLPSAFEA